MRDAAARSPWPGLPAYAMQLGQACRAGPVPGTPDPPFGVAIHPGQTWRRPSGLGIMRAPTRRWRDRDRLVCILESS